MRTGQAGASLAVCPCGWNSEVKGPHRYTIQDTKVRLHWRDVIRRKMAELDALERDPGGAARDLKAGAIAIGLLAVNLIGWLTVAGAGS